VHASDTHAADVRAVDPRPFIDRLVAYWRDPPLQPDAAAFVAQCPVPVYVVSNADEDDLREALRRCGLAQLEFGQGQRLPAQPGRVVGAVTSEEARAYKPEPAIFEIALARTGWRRDRVLHVGDSLHSDVGGARRAGLKCAWINRGHRIHDIGTDQPDFELPDLGALLEMLNGRDQGIEVLQQPSGSEA
jgi:2-haloacid dehalogenase/putative hydrolase of the HAD superfamily